MKLKHFEIRDRLTIETHILRYEPIVSDLNFTAMFMWRNFFRTVYAIAEGYLCIICGGQDGQPYALPPVGPSDGEAFNEVISRLKNCFESNGCKFIIKNADDAFCEKIRASGKFDVEIIFDRDNCDYVYLVQDLIDLKGGKYDAKRNHIKKFQSSYTYEVRTFTSSDCDAELLKGCVDLSRKWSEEHDYKNDEAIYLEYEANKELLNNFGKLDLKGITVVSEGRVIGYSIGSMLNSDTAVIHCEKADNAVPGIYAFLNREFLLRSWSEVKYVNREEDIGIEGIRRAKLSYHPAMLVNKSVIVFKG
jgi:hypothetical protein